MQTIAGNVTPLLKPEYTALGYRLTRNDDFIYLWIPNYSVPIVFSAHGVQMEAIEQAIHANITKGAV